MTLATVLIGNNENSKLYVNLKERACREIGINVKKIELDENTNNEKITSIIKELNKDCNGILIQLPLPKNLDKERILNSIAYEKDIDGLTSISLGKLILGDEKNAPCTAKAIIHVLENNTIIKGKNITIIGSGNIGKPLSIMLLNRGATMTVCNEFTKNIKNFTEKSDIIISCAGSPGIIKEDIIKKNSIVIDVGISRIKNTVKGDIDKNIVKKASLLCPVPGGIGPITIAMLIKRLVNES